MTLRAIVAYVALCAGLSAYQVHGFTSLVFYGLGLLACILLVPVEKWLATRRAYASELKQFDIEVQAARLASQLIGGKR
jgi:hypothetical protein